MLIDKTGIQLYYALDYNYMQ